jgi:hypothetical protein
MLIQLLGLSGLLKGLTWKRLANAVTKASAKEIARPLKAEIDQLTPVRRAQVGSELIRIGAALRDGDTQGASELLAQLVGGIRV